MTWIASHPEIRRFIVAIVFWIGVIALVTRRHQTKVQIAIQIAVWALLVISAVLLFKHLN